MKFSLTFILVFLFSLPAYSALCPDHLGKLPIQQNGRVKPLLVHAYETMNFLAKKQLPKKPSLLEQYCQLSLNGTAYDQEIQLKVKIEHEKTKKLLNLTENKDTILYGNLILAVSEIRAEYSQLKFSDGYKKELSSLLNKIGLYQEVTNGTNFLYYTSDWMPLKSALVPPYTAEKISEVLKKSEERFLSVPDSSKTYKIEYSYFKAKPFSISILITFLSLVFFVARKSSKLGFIFLAATLIIQTLGMALRVYISGRAPVTNMYETVMWSGYTAVILSLFLYYGRPQRIFLIVGLVYNFCSLMMMNFAHGMLDPSISPLVPVLRDNFWLSTHVTSVVLSYGAFALSWVLANYVLFKNRFSVLSSADLKHYTDLIYSCLKYGVVSLAAGLILGGVWADYSWGRFWGWDPKETWSLIVLILYMAILHGRYTNWIGPKQFIPFVALSFLSVMFAWFGVNYILAAGLHSYGFSEGGAVFLGTFFFLQIAFVLLTIRWSDGQRTTSA